MSFSPLGALLAANPVFSCHSFSCLGVGSEDSKLLVGYRALGPGRSQLLLVWLNGIIGDAELYLEALQPGFQAQAISRTFSCVALSKLVPHSPFISPGAPASAPASDCCIERLWCLLRLRSLGPSGQLYSRSPSLLQCACLFFPKESWGNQGREDCIVGVS